MNFRLRLAAESVAAGGVIAYPTEAVWGLGCDPFQPDAIQRLLTLKRRSLSKGLILVAGDWQQLAWLLEDLPADRQHTLQQSWPGPNTWLVPHRGRVPHWLSGEFATIALRVSAHPVVAALCSAVGGPLVSTSANVTRAQAATEMFQVRRYFGSRLDTIMPGKLGGSRAPSTIRDLESGRLIRAAVPA